MTLRFLESANDAGDNKKNISGGRTIWAKQADILLT